jgi:hypothetical protein
MSAEDTWTQIEGVADPLDIVNFEDSLETSAEKKAREAREKAARLAEDELGLKKAIHEENRGSWNDLERDVFGRDPEELAQQMADARAAADGMESSGVTTPSGRKGRFDFGTPNTLTDGGGQPSEDQLRNLYDTSRVMSETEFKKQVKAFEAETGGTALSDEQIRNLYDTGRNASFDDYKKNHLSKQIAGNQESVRSKGSITDHDRQRALAQIEAGEKNTIQGKLAAARGQHQSAVDRLKGDLDGIDAPEVQDFQNDWRVDDRREYISPEAKAAQKQSMDKTWGLTDTKETAEERLMREVARRSMETDLRGQREAQANDLRTRGAYGSGAELAGFYGAQQEAAQRRSLEEMGANANAQKRAILALDSFGTQAANLGAQDVQVGIAQDANTRFNSESQQGWSKFKTRAQQEEAERQARIAATKSDADIGVTDATRNDEKYLTNTKVGITAGKTGSNTQGGQIVGDATRNLGQNFKERALGFDADAAELTHNGMF